MNYKNNCMFCVWSKRECTYTFEGQNYYGSICKHPNAVIPGRGDYIYPLIYDQCDCNGWLRDNKRIKNYIKYTINHPMEVKSIKTSLELLNELSDFSN